jgi:hypothetical protein
VTLPGKHENGGQSALWPPFSQVVLKAAMWPSLPFHAASLAATEKVKLSFVSPRSLGKRALV